MKYAIAASLFVQGIQAFPAGALDAYHKANPQADFATLAKRQVPGGDPLQISRNEKNCGVIPCLVFSEDQFVSTSGQHAYADPGPADIRGPCPGLNAAANHGYLPRNGIATLPETVDGMLELYGMSPDLSGFLAAYAIVLDGDIISQRWSIGGAPPQSGLGDILLGKPQGISYSHNKYEGDTSIGRFDAYMNDGDAVSLDINQFRRAYDLGLEDDRYTMDVFRRATEENQQFSIANNPYYFAPLFSTTLVAPAAYNFVINFMSNHSAEEPEGYLDTKMFKEFFAITGDGDDLAWESGKERIPENWYRRPLTRQYTAADVFFDLGIAWAAYPNTFRFGGNTNGVNTYTGVDLGDLTGGVMNGASIFEGNNFACLVFQSMQQGIPDFLKGVVSDIGAAMTFFRENAAPVFDNLACPDLAKYDSSVFNAYPGRDYSPTDPNNN